MTQMPTLSPFMTPNPIGTIFGSVGDGIWLNGRNLGRLRGAPQAPPSRDPPHVPWLGRPTLIPLRQAQHASAR
jgi:hypothetical protein